MRKLLAAVVVAAAFLGAGAAQAQNSPAAQRVLDRARAAAGGAAAWNMLRGLHEVGEENGAAFERWLDPLRYGMRRETPAGGAGEKLVQAYNGAAEWRVLAGGVLTGSDKGEHYAHVRSEAFFGAYGFFYPGRFDLRSSHVGTRAHEGRSYEVLRVQPAGGRPRELWFDRGSGLLGRMVEPAADGASPRAVEIGDYRRVGRVKLPFRFTVTGGGLTQPVVRTLKTIDFRPADRARFSLPPPTKAEAAEPAGKTS